MTKSSKQKEIDVRGGIILEYNLKVSYMQVLPINGNTEDIDGTIRLLDGNGNFLNKFLHYQLKSTSSIKKEKYHCKRKVIDFLISTSVPTILFVVDITTKKVYWFFFDEKNKSNYEIEKDKSGRTLELKGNEVSQINAPELSNRWSKFAQTHSYREISESLNKMVLEYAENSIKCIGLLYLIKIVRKKEVGIFFNKILNISKSEVESIFSRFAKEKIISETINLYIIENDQIGLESLDELLTTIPIHKLYDLIVDKERRLNILDQLSTLESKNAESYLHDYGNKLYKLINESKTNDEISDYLDYIQRFSYRIPDITFKVAKKIINSEAKPSRELKIKWFGFKGITHEKIIFKIIEILEDLSYLRPIKYINLLIKLSIIEEFHDASIEKLCKLAEFNFEILKRAGYYFQIKLLDEIEKWGKAKSLKYKYAIINICKKLLRSEFEGISMVDYKTINLKFGPLHPSNEISKIRRRSINLLINLFLSDKTIKIRKEVIQSLKNASRLPSRGNYSSELEEIIVENVNQILKFYIDKFSLLDEELIIDIEDETYWLRRRFGSERIKKIEELQERIVSNEEYLKFKTFYGFDFIIDSSDWKKNREKRIESINKFVKEITSKNWNEWKERINTVANKYSTEEAGKFQYFNYFLQNLSKEKPGLAFSLLDQKNNFLDPFKIHIMTGIMNSPQKNKGEKILVDLIENKENLEFASNLYNQAVDFNPAIFKKIVENAIKLKNVNLLYNLLKTCIENYSKNENLKEIFFRIIRKLIQVNDDSWGTMIFWVEDYSIFSSLTSKEAELLLSSLIPNPKIDFPLEQILTPIFIDFPREVAQFFFNRVKFHLENMDDYLYDVIPYRLNDLQKLFRANEQILVPEIFKWFKEENKVFHLYARNLLRQIYPNIDSEFFIQCLEEMIDDGGNKNALQVLSILRAWEGGISIHSICKSFIKQYLKDKSDENYNFYKTELLIILTQTGVVSGEYGFSEALKVKKDEIQSWKKEKDETLRMFIADYEAYLDHYIQIHHDRADEDILLMKKGIR